MQQCNNRYPAGKNRLVDAFCRLMEETNFDSVSTKALSLTAGVSEGLMYKYFGSKEGLLYYCLNAQLLRLEKAVAERIKDASTFPEMIHAGILTCLETLVDKQAFSRMLFLEAARFQDFSSSDACQTLTGYSCRFMEMMRAGMACGEVRASIDPSAVRAVICGAISQCCIDRIVLKDTADVKELARDIAGILIGGFLV